jgi:hypothetical protein
MQIENTTAYGLCVQWVLERPGRLFVQVWFRRRWYSRHGTCQCMCRMVPWLRRFSCLPNRVTTGQGSFFTLVPGSTKCLGSLVLSPRLKHSFISIALTSSICRMTLSTYVNGKTNPLKLVPKEHTFHSCVSEVAVQIYILPSYEVPTLHLEFSVTHSFDVSLYGTSVVVLYLTLELHANRTRSIAAYV